MRQAFLSRRIYQLKYLTEYHLIFKRLIMNMKIFTMNYEMNIISVNNLQQTVSGRKYRHLKSIHLFVVTLLKLKHSTISSSLRPIIGPPYTVVHCSHTQNYFQKELLGVTLNLHKSVQNNTSLN